MRRLFVGFVITLAAWLALTGVAAACFGAGSGAFRKVESNGGAAIRGLQGTTNLRVTAPIGAFEQHVHPAQLQSGSSGDFVAIGHARGNGVLGCTPDYNTTWDAYVDGKSFGNYFCQTVVTDDASPVSSRKFKMTRGQLCSPGWFQFTWEGTLEYCIAANFGGDWFAAVGIENLNVVGANTDVRYYQLKVKMNNIWSDFGGAFLPPLWPSQCTEHGYQIDVVNTKQIKFFLPPYD